MGERAGDSRKRLGFAWFQSQPHAGCVAEAPLVFSAKWRRLNELI